MHDNPLLGPFNASSLHWPTPPSSIAVRSLNSRQPWSCCEANKATCDRVVKDAWQSITSTKSNSHHVCNPRNSSVLLVGIMSAPLHDARRHAIRTSWLQWARGSSAIAACFVIGSRKLLRSIRVAIRKEQAENDDMIQLPSIEDGRTPAITIAKAHAWWRAAARLLLVSEGLRFVAKVDDDSFVHVPRLLTTAMLGIGCEPFIYFGALALTGYDAQRFSKCGFSWYGMANEPPVKKRCKQDGLFPRFPFAVGQLELLSAPLVRQLAVSSDFAGFAHASAATNAQDEDVALGLVIGNAHLTGLLNVTYVGTHDAMSPFSMHNLGCTVRAAGLYAPPSAKSMVIHHVTEPAAMRYVMRIVQQRAPHEPEKCRRAMRSAGPSAGSRALLHAWTRRGHARKEAANERAAKKRIKQEEALKALKADLAQQRLEIAAGQQQHARLQQQHFDLRYTAVYV